jgi:hypothetical protein
LSWFLLAYACANAKGLGPRVRAATSVTEAARQDMPIFSLLLDICCCYDELVIVNTVTMIDDANTLQAQCKGLRDEARSMHFAVITCRAVLEERKITIIIVAGKAVHFQHAQAHSQP